MKAISAAPLRLHTPDLPDLRALSVITSGTNRSWKPYLTFGGGLLWTSLDVNEIDRIFNFQVIAGARLRFIPRHGPGWIVEFRNHRISNAGTAGETSAPTPPYYRR
jgi:hypothetical protein